MGRETAGIFTKLIFLIKAADALSSRMLLANSLTRSCGFYAFVSTWNELLIKCRLLQPALQSNHHRVSILIPASGIYSLSFSLASGEHGQRKPRGKPMGFLLIFGLEIFRPIGRKSCTFFSHQVDLWKSTMVVCQESKSIYILRTLQCEAHITLRIVSIRSGVVSR